MDRNNDDNDDNSKEHQEYHYHSPPDDHPLSPPRRRRRVSDNNVSKQQQSMIVEPELTQPLVDINDEKEPDKAETSQEPTADFLRERRTEREQLLFEKEKTRRIRAQADLVKNLVDAGFSKQEIAEQLKHI